MSPLTHPLFERGKKTRTGTVHHQLRYDPMRSSQPRNCLHPLLSTDFLRFPVDSRTDISRDKITATVILPFFGLHAQYQLCHATVWSSAPLQNTLESVPATTTIQINATTTKHSTTTKKDKQVQTPRQEHSQEKPRLLETRKLSETSGSLAFVANLCRPHRGHCRCTCHHSNDHKWVSAVTCASIGRNDSILLLLV